MSLARTKHWSRLEYERLVNLGAFHPEERVELVGGSLMVREPQASPHSTAIRAVEEGLRTMLGAGWDVRTKMPIALDDESEPEPDVSVVPGTFRDYTHGHPSRPRCSSKSRTRVSRSIEGTKAASTPAPACPSTGS